MSVLPRLLVTTVTAVTLAAVPSVREASPGPADPSGPITPSGPAGAGCDPGSGPDLSGRDLTTVTDLPADLSCANLTGVRADGVDLGSVRLDRAILRDASLRGTALRQLRGADLRGARLVGARLANADIGGADLRGADLSRAELTNAGLQDALLTAATLHDAGLGSVRADRADFTRARLDRADLSHGKFYDAIFREASLVGAELHFSELHGAAFEDADVTDADTRFARGADLSGSTSRMPVGWKIFLGMLGLVAAWILRKVVSRRLRRRREAGQAAAESAIRFEEFRKELEEDVTRFGEEIDRLDEEGGGNADWNRALDCYDTAKESLAAAREHADLKFVALALERGRNALSRPARDGRDDRRTGRAG
ncbi:pentapeptide repeat-containing protein [Planobispora longispora]|uniref:Pentapeptide repeat-containing protein n=1 Tax=Planobispora longispora TaxID=28887 RepID=A0A8J3RI29_9ACTN|nr:pentapeptide repeat-containing protein [Planobispora longispora]GIH75284.1 hypothetical protein Plo01_17130 [Planobispora longispora]